MKINLKKTIDRVYEVSTLPSRSSALKTDKDLKKGGFF